MQASRSRTSPRLSAAERRTVLLDGALALFADRGYDTTTTGDIAKAADVTKPVLYDHFSSKQELYVVLLEREAGRMVAATVEGFDPEAPVETRLHDLAVRAVDFARDHQPSALLLLQLPLGDAEVRAAHEKARAAARDLIAAAILADPLFDRSPGLSRQRSAELLADVHNAVLERLVRWALEYPEIPTRVLARTFVDVLWRGAAGTNR